MDNKIYKSELEGSTVLLITSVAVDIKELLKAVKLVDSENKYFQKFRNEKRKIEWLLIRWLLQQEIGRDVVIGYEDSGKPYLVDSKFKISISHSKEFVALMISKQQVGVDIESISQRVLKVKDKYLTAKELSFFKDDNLLEYSTIAWAAKEALFKISPIQAFDFKKDILIYPFKLSESGVFKGEVNKYDVNLEYSVHYFFKENNVVVWIQD